jgi:hypothetical protein
VLSVKIAFIAFCFMLLLHLGVVAASSVDGGVVFWWVKPGVYFTYHVRFSAPHLHLVDDMWYWAEEALFNWSIVKIEQGRVVVNLTLTLLNAAQCRDHYACPGRDAVLVNRALSTLVEVDLETLGVYANGSWVGEWFFLATLDQLRGEKGKLIVERSDIVTTTVTHIEFNETIRQHVEIVEAFISLLREELGDEASRYVEILDPLRVGFSIGINGTSEGLRLLRFSLRGLAGFNYIKPPPSDFSIGVRGYNISGDRIATLGASPGPGRGTILDGIKQGVYIVEREVPVGPYKVFSLRFKGTPLKVYALPHPYYPDPRNYACFAYSPDSRELYMFGGIGCWPVGATSVSAYYDFITGVALYARVKGIATHWFLNPYYAALGVREVRRDAVVPTDLSIEFTLVDTNISFERPVIGGVEHSYTPLQVALVGVAVVAVLLVVKTIMSKRRKTLNMS